MLIGFNNDIEFNGMMFHIQTEDHGIKDGHITTILFYSGQILDSKKIGYHEDIEGITEEEEKKKVIKKRMVTLHREFYKKLFDGTYNEAVEHLLKKPEQTSESSSAIKKMELKVTPPPSPPRASSPPAAPPPVPLQARVLKPHDDKHAFRGLIWPEKDLAIDGLVLAFWQPR